MASCFKTRRRRHRLDTPRSTIAGRLSLSHAKDDVVEVGRVRQGSDALDTGDNQTLGSHADLLDTVHLRRGSGEALRQRLRIEILRQVDEVTNPIKGDQHRGTVLPAAVVTPGLVDHRR